MSSRHNGETWWHFLGCRTLNQRDQRYVECQHGDIWFPFHSCGITAGTPADITILPSRRWACQTFHSTSMFSRKKKRKKKKKLRFTANCDTPASPWYLDICDGFDLTKAIRCQWHLASASGDRQVKEASQQIGPEGDRREVGDVWGSSHGDAGLDTLLTHKHAFMCILDNGRTQNHSRASCHLFLQLQICVSYCSTSA